MRTAMLLVPALLLVACGSDSESTESSGVVIGNARVVRVVDGDTLVVNVGGREERLRLIGIDTPESVKPDTPVECFGHEATAFTESLLPDGTDIRLERDVEARDPFDRLLAYAYRVDDGLFVNLEIIRQGYAQPLTIPPNVAHADEFVAAARVAEADDVGLWAACTG
ncbi:MAG TPA: thermonuclease family protein [Ilumatobacteraceae bacterium]|nr:thermonuclease family protein [Ilumatobacteraceae bacterium]